MFLILHGDKEIYEYNFFKPEKLQSYFSIHAALDSIEAVSNRKQYYIGLIKSEDLPLFCFMNPVGLKLLLQLPIKGTLDKKMEMSIKEFFVEANRQLAIALMNPLYRPKAEIRSPIFEQKIINLGKEYLRVFFDKRK